MYFHVFTYPEFEYKYSFGRNGRGSGEFTGNVAFDLTPQYLWAYSAVKTELLAYDIKNGSTMAARRIQLDEKLMDGVVRFSAVNDSLFAFTLMRTGEKSVYLINDRSEVVETYAERPVAAKNINPLAARKTWQTFIAYNPKNNKLVTTSLGGEVLNIIDLDKKTEIVSIGPKGIPAVIKLGNGITTDIDGFGYTLATDNYIYALFSGLSREERRARRGESEKTILRVYDYYGMPVQAYEMSEKIISFHVDENASKIYATVDNEENCIFVYEI